MFLGKVKIGLKSTNIRLSTLIFLECKLEVYYFIKITFCTLKTDTENAELRVFVFGTFLCDFFVMIFHAWLGMIICNMLLHDLAYELWNHTCLTVIRYYVRT